MRAREFLQEDYNKSLDSDLNNLLVRAKASGSADIKTKNIVKQLYKMGYSVNLNNIMPLLSNNPVVLNATPEIIKLTKPDGASAEETPDTGPDTDSIARKEKEDADHVTDMAQTAAKKQINK
jgi:hypothetical protein